MLEGLNEVDWKSLGCSSASHLDVTDVPKWIGELLSTDDHVREDARKNLTTIACVAGAVQEIAAHIIPFLIELLVYENTPEKDRILDLISLLGGTQNPGGAQYEIWARNAYEVAKKGVEIYQGLLVGKDERARSRAASLLSFFPGYAIKTLPYLIDQLDRPMDRPEHVLWDCRRLIEDNELLPGDLVASCTKRFKEIMEASTDKVVALTAAVSLLRILKAEAPSGAIKVVVEQLSNPDTYPKRAKIGSGFAGVWIDGPLVYSLSRALRLVGEDKGTQPLLACFAEIPKVEDAHTVSTALLDVVFNKDIFITYDASLSVNDGKGMSISYHPSSVSTEEIYVERFVARLSPNQRLVLQALVDRGDYWEIRSDLLEFYGFPHSKIIVREYLYR